MVGGTLSTPNTIGETGFTDIRLVKKYDIAMCPLWTVHGFGPYRKCYEVI
jgi:hypothetical protein